MSNPWLTSNDIVEAVKRRISMPLYQSTFEPNDILQFANDVMREEILPNILQYHEEYFVVESSVELQSNQSKYPIPNRAVGMKLRDIVFGDGNATDSLPYGNTFETTRVNADDKVWFEGSGLGNGIPYRLYLQGNDVVITPSVDANPTGVLVFYWFMRPNQLVEESRSFILSAFSKTIVVNNTSLTAGDTVTLGVESNGVITNTVFTAGTSFTIGGTSSASATNLVTAINAAALGFTASNGSPATSTVTITYSNRNNTVASSDSAALSVQTTLGLVSAAAVPSNITAGSYVDLLQTLPGHKIINYDVLVPTAGVSGSTISLAEVDVLTNIIVGDYVCSRNECIIPQIPPELQSNLVQRVCSRILEAIGDKEGMAVSDAKVDKLDRSEASLIDDRIEGSPQKILARHSLLRYGSLFNRRGW
jgi:hypothetical protein